MSPIPLGRPAIRRVQVPPSATLIKTKGLTLSMNTSIFLEKTTSHDILTFLLEAGTPQGEADIWHAIGHPKGLTRMAIHTALKRHVMSGCLTKLHAGQDSRYAFSKDYQNMIVDIGGRLAKNPGIVI